MPQEEAMDRRRQSGTSASPKELSQAYGNWLRTFDWSHWVTLTTSRTYSPDRLRKAFDEEFVRFATKTTQNPVQYFYAIEGGALGDRPHLHALIAGTSQLECARLKAAWRHGQRVEVAVYVPHLGAAHYLAKEIGGRVLLYGWSNRLAPVRTKFAA
jgi:hypothetical protein